MTRTKTFVCGLAVAVLTAAPLLAQNTKTQSDRDNRQTDRAQAGRLDPATQGPNIRASKLMGMNIQNAQGKGVGEVNDFVLDANTGKIRYAAVTYGGFLGIGNKMFAVPFDAFKIQRDPNDRDELVLVLNVTQQQLEGAVGFDESNWPDFADANFVRDLDKRYGVERRRLRDSKVNVDIDKNGVDVDIERDDR